ncbi:capsule biosynthesis protein [Caldovatus sp. SYSU G05006]|uniref:Capsule biosynthesis protein n=1 Tax=Caldovatus aquaticus TaxID=2865671 RepID=A0ABS7F473_9PROT|nr:capsule biosynthesis protein [Caldovatus aquaticus]
MRRLAAWAARRAFLLAVVLPSLLGAAYFLGIAADQYVSEARFVVRGRAGTAGGGLSGLGSLLGGAGLAPSHEEAQAVRDFLASHGAVDALGGRVDLVAIFTRPEADWLSRLWWTDPERLTRYFTSMVTASYDTTSGLITLRVRSFRPEDSRRLAEELLVLSEALVNRMSERAREDALRIAREEVAIAERRVIAAREALTALRARQQALDPSRGAAIATETIGQLEGQLTVARAELEARSRFMRPDNPGLLEVRNRIAALERQIAEERQRHTAGGTALAGQLAEYDRLMLERELADRQLASAVASLEQARVEAQRQQVFLARVVEPNLAEYPLYPRRIMNSIGLFVGLAVLYGIARLLIAGMREHAA